MQITNPVRLNAIENANATANANANVLHLPPPGKWCTLSLISPSPHEPGAVADALYSSPPPRHGKRRASRSPSGSPPPHAKRRKAPLATVPAANSELIRQLNLTLPHGHVQPVMIKRILDLGGAPPTMLMTILRCMAEMPGYEKDRWDAVLTLCGFGEDDRCLMIAVMTGILTFPSLCDS